MKKPAIKMTLERSSDAFWAYAIVKGGMITTNGETLEELKTHVVEATNLFYEDKGVSYALNEIQFTFDIQSFFEYYGLNAKAVASRIGMSDRLLAKFANGIKKPSGKQIERIMKGVRELGQELSNMQLR